MFVVIVTYLRPLSEVDAAVPDHRAFLARHYAAGTFLLSGPQVPRTGGVILARNVSRDELTALLAEDPFSQRGLAEYRIVEFAPNLAAADFAHLLPAD